MFRCSDGCHLFLWLGENENNLQHFLEAIGIRDQLQKDSDLTPVILNSWQGYFQLTYDQKARLEKIIADKLLTQTAQEWEDQLPRFSVIMYRTHEEWLVLNVLLESGVLAYMDNGQSRLTVPGRFVTVDGPQGIMPDTYCEPEMISWNEAQASLPEPFVTTQQSSSTVLNKGDLLSGLKVLDLSKIVAGPTSSYTLAQYGAEVIRLNATDTPSHWQMCVDHGQGKRCSF